MDVVSFKYLWEIQIKIVETLIDGLELNFLSGLATYIYIKELSAYRKQLEPWKWMALWEENVERRSTKNGTPRNTSCLENQ